MHLTILFWTINFQAYYALDVPHWFGEQLREILLPDFPAETDEFRRETAMTTPEIIERDGYPAEIYSLETKDGYIIELHRIPHGKENNKRQDRIPVLYVPGISCSSAMFVDREEHSIGYILAENGYDVWMGNPRGNMYSRKHVTLDPNEKQFWMFSMDDIGLYDVPAMIDLILQTTLSQHIQMITHSMGAVVTLMTFTRLPEYNSKVKGTVHLAPAMRSRYMPTLFRPILDRFPAIEELYPLSWNREIFRHSELLLWLLFTLCPHQNPFICESGYSSLTGYKPKVKRDILPRLISHCPTGTSLNLFFQYGQMEQNTKKIKAFDYGNKKLNLQKYGQSIDAKIFVIRKKDLWSGLTIWNLFELDKWRVLLVWQEDPPDYDFKKVTTPTALFYATNDPLGDPIDVAVLITELNSSFQTYIIKDPLYTHVDFFWGRGAEDLVFKPVMETLQRMWNERS